MKKTHLKIWFIQNKRTVRLFLLSIYHFCMHVTQFFIYKMWTFFKLIFQTVICFGRARDVCNCIVRSVFLLHNARRCSKNEKETNIFIKNSTVPLFLIGSSFSWKHRWSESAYIAQAVPKRSQSYHSRYLSDLNSYSMRPLTWAESFVIGCSQCFFRFKSYNLNSVKLSTSRDKTFLCFNAISTLSCSLDERYYTGEYNYVCSFRCGI